MISDKYLKYSFLNALFFVVFLWVMFLFQNVVLSDISGYALYPRSLRGLWGFLFSPLLHANAYHLFNNSTAAFFFLWVLFYFFPRDWHKVLLWSYFIPNFFVWLFARAGYHIGFSGVIFSLAFFEFFIGIFSKQRSLSAISLIIVFLYGGLLWQVFPYKSDISWESHLFGALSGIVLALLLKGKYSKRGKVSEGSVSYSRGIYGFRGITHTEQPYYGSYGESSTYNFKIKVKVKT